MVDALTILTALNDTTSLRLGLLETRGYDPEIPECDLRERLDTCIKPGAADIIIPQLLQLGLVERTGKADLRRSKLGESFNTLMWAMHEGEHYGEPINTKEHQIAEAQKEINVSQPDAAEIPDDAIPIMEIIAI